MESPLHISFPAPQAETKVGGKQLHLGCGELVGPSWTNVDGSPNVILDNHILLKWLLFPFLPRSAGRRKFETVRYFDLRKRWEFRDGEFDAVYSSHFFEHLSLKDGEHVLRETFRVLKPGGVVRFLLPTVEAEVEEYLRRKRAGDTLAATDLAQSLNIFEDEPKGSWWYRLYFRLYNKNSHKMLYDESSLRFYFQTAGFKGVQPRRYLDSAIAHLKEVEREDRFQKAVCIEARKP